jgi:putative copper resistance protein D
MELALSQVFATTLVNLSLAWIVGVLASRFWLMTATARWREPVRKRLSFSMTAGLLACALGSVLSAWAAAAAMADVPWLDAEPAFSEMLMSTHYGHAALAAFGFLVLAIAVDRRLARTNSDIRYLGSIAVLVLLVAAARVSIGHAFEHGPMSVAVWVELLHILFMSLWAGAVFVSGWIVLPAVAAAGLPDDGRTRYLASLSNWATVALAGILATGAYNSYRMLGSLRDLIESDYGHVLVFKLCFVLLAIALGGLNRFYGLPAAASNGDPVRTQQGLRVVIAILCVESIALLLVLVAAAVLTSSAPPG